MPPHLLFKDADSSLNNVLFVDMMEKGLFTMSKTRSDWVSSNVMESLLNFRNQFIELSKLSFSIMLS